MAPDPVKKFKQHSPHAKELEPGSSEEKFLAALSDEEVDALLAIDKAADSHGVARVGAAAY